MKRNTTLNLPAELIRKTRTYAAAHGTTMTKLIQSHLERLTADLHAEPKSVLKKYSDGEISTRDACRALDLRDGADLLLALNDARLEHPKPANHVIEAQADSFKAVWDNLK